MSQIKLCVLWKVLCLRFLAIWYFVICCPILVNLAFAENTSGNGDSNDQAASQSPPSISFSESFYKETFLSALLMVTFLIISCYFTRCLCRKKTKGNDCRKKTKGNDAIIERLFALTIIAFAGSLVVISGFADVAAPLFGILGMLTGYLLGSWKK